MAVKEKTTTNLPIPKPIHRRLKRYAERDGRILQAVAGDAVREYLDKHEHETPRHKTASDNGNEA